MTPSKGVWSLIKRDIHDIWHEAVPVGLWVCFLCFLILLGIFGPCAFMGGG